MSKRAYRFPPFLKPPRFTSKYIRAHVLARPYPITGSYAFLSSPLFPNSLLSLSLLLASILDLASLSTFWSNQLLVFCSTIVVSPYSNSYELVTVVAVVRC
ncbi:hypothetical protein ACTXT7_015914 [Hymenolepis weldensis]